MEAFYFISAPLWAIQHARVVFVNIETLHPEMFRHAVDVPFIFELLKIERTVDPDERLVIVHLLDLDSASRIAIGLAETLFEGFCVV